MSDHLAKKYQKKTDREHILDAPDTYVGSIVPDTISIWTEKDDRIVWRDDVKMNAGLYKCFDEALVNARDHVVRMADKVAKGETKFPVKNIEVTIGDDGVITIMNDGDGIDVEQHPEYKIWIPELIFGHLRTSTNYRKDEKKIVGGKNGFGIKLVFIYSLWGRIETVDNTRGLMYTQMFRNNLSIIEPPTVTKTKAKPYTKIQFMPDYSRFGCADLSPDMRSLFKRRVYDIGAVTDAKITVKFNGTTIPVKSFEQYVNLYIGDKTQTARIFEQDANDGARGRWEYAVCLTPHGEFTQVSFVNGIFTAKGGKHVDYVMGQIVKKLIAYIEKKKKVTVKPAVIKEQLMLFLNCVIENPTFDSQTKEYLNTKQSDFGSVCDVSEKFIEKVAKMGVMDQAVSINEIKETKQVKKADGKKTRRIAGIPKLNDAEFAGTAKSGDCVLILCEGDSAKAGVVSGLSKEDRNYIGVYPLKGKILNVRGETAMNVAKNEEIADLKKILGLEVGKKYATSEDVTRNLRYGRVMFMTDQDLDGVHIRGLGINLFQSQWTELSKVDGFLSFMNTPIIKARRATREIRFYNSQEYEAWKETPEGKQNWTIKYYKGLGTSTANEFKEYFKHKRVVEFAHTGAECDDSIDLVFNKKRADDRKEWLGKYDKTATLDMTKTKIPYNEFVNKEMIHYSKYDNERSIPNLVDGLKTSQRKILYSAFKRNLREEIKVAQFGGYVSEHSAYHHGEASLVKAIVGMAQEFMGSNNINLLMPNGQFGTRIQGGKDSSSERYIYTCLNTLSRAIYPEADDAVLTYMDDDGKQVEPEYYVPIIPMILVNGAKGIGTGFSTDIPQFDPLRIIEYLKNKINDVEDKDNVELAPYFEGFRGSIRRVNDIVPYKYEQRGVYTLTDKTAHITELPVGTWTENYKLMLEKMLDPAAKNQWLKEYSEVCTDALIDFKLTLKEPMTEEEFEKRFGMIDTINTSNMYLFDPLQRMKKYDDVTDIIEDYFDVRYETYVKRKAALLCEYERQLVLISNKYRFIKEQLDGSLDLRGKPNKEVTELLESRKYAKIDDGFKYLVSMPISSLIKENLEKLKEDNQRTSDMLEELKVTTCSQMWIKELDELRDLIVKYREERNARVYGVEPKVVKTRRVVKKA